jgi:hypothetical protein
MFIRQCCYLLACKYWQWTVARRHNTNKLMPWGGGGGAQGHIEIDIAVWTFLRW